MVGAQKFERVRCEVDDQQSTSGGQQSSSFPNGSRRVIEEVKNLMEGFKLPG